MITWPNLLTILRIVAIPPMVVFILERNSFAAFLVIVLATATDFFDGYVARWLGQESKLGKVLDPLADKFFGGAGFVSLCIAGYLPWVIFGLFVARDALILLVMLVLTWQKKRILTETKVGKFSTALFMISLALVVIELPFAVYLFLACFAIYLYTGILYAIRIFQSPEVKEIRQKAKTYFRKSQSYERDSIPDRPPEELPSMSIQKPASIIWQGREILRIPVRTHEIKPPDRLWEQVERYVKGLLQPGDTLVLSEKVVSAAQGRLVRSSEIRPSRLAVFLSSKVVKVPYGIGLGSPETMQLALDECGTWRILLAAAFGALGKLLWIKGLFYYVAGRQAAWIDGDAPYGMLQGYAVLGPKLPAKVCLELDQLLGCRVAILDVNDIGGCEICGASPGTERKMVLALMRDNPLGQDIEQTPIGILRPITNIDWCLYPWQIHGEIAAPEDGGLEERN